MEKKEMWMEKLKEKLADYAEPTPASGWERLEKELMPPAEKRINPYRRWAAAAAVLLVTASSVSLYFLNSPAADEMRRTPTPVLATAPDAMPLSQSPVAPVAKVEPVTAVRVTSRTRNVLAQSTPAKTEPVITTVSPAIVSPTITDENRQPATDSSEKERATSSEQPKTKEVRRPSSRDKLHLPVQAASSKTARWSIGASVGNAGAITGNTEDFAALRDSRLDMASALNGVVQIPSDQQVVFKEGVPYLQGTREVIDIEHHQPISFGLSVRKGLAKGFSIETGLTYTLLSSDLKLSGSNAMESQKLHYLGIPLRANWNFLEKKLFTLYVSGGGVIEKCVSGKLADEKITVKPLQFSVAGAVGAQVNATRQLGIYVEPGVAYFFNDGSNVQTIRKDTPFNFNLQAGVRFTY